MLWLSACRSGERCRCFGASAGRRSCLAAPPLGSRPLGSDLTARAHPVPRNGASGGYQPWMPCCGLRETPRRVGEYCASSDRSPAEAHFCMTVIAIGEFDVKPGAEAAFEDAFSNRPASEPPTGAHAVDFGRSQEHPGRYRRVGIWQSRKEWERFQAADGQKGLWSQVREHLGTAPRFEFYELLEQGCFAAVRSHTPRISACGGSSQRRAARGRVCLGACGDDPRLILGLRDRYIRCGVRGGATVGAGGSLITAALAGAAGRPRLLCPPAPATSAGPRGAGQFGRWACWQT